MGRSFIISMLVLCASAIMNAQTRIYDQKVEVSGDSVVVSFNLAPDKNVPSRYKEVILPYLYNGKDSIMLESCEVFGKGRLMREKQEKHLRGEKDWEPGNMQTVAGNEFRYVSRVPLKRWMTLANLGIKRYLTGCNCEKDHSDETLGQSEQLFVIPVLPARKPSGYTLEDVGHKWDFGKDELEIIFKVSRAELDSTVFNNFKTFENILKAVDNIFSVLHSKVDRIEVTGYASPEGSVSFNTWLGERRAWALVDYIISHRPQYNLTRDNFKIINGKENWLGLRRMLVDTEIEYRDSVISIIDSPLSEVRKKRAIMNIEGGKVWKNILDNIYPHLRSARYLAVYYDSESDLAAKTINAANALIRSGEYAAAYENLHSVSSDLRAYNSLGVALMMQGKYEDAMVWFEKALETGCDSAQKNIDFIEEELERESRHNKEIEEYLNKYN